jgi:hypothetical protein
MCPSDERRRTAIVWHIENLDVRFVLTEIRTILCRPQLDLHAGECISDMVAEAMASRGLAISA